MPVKGFSLLELVVATTIAGILLAVAIPGWSHVRAAAGPGAVRAELGAMLLDAVGHSAVAAVEVVVCGRSGGDQCSGLPDWDSGWIAFADANGDRRRDEGERLLNRRDALPDDVHLRTTQGRSRLVFQPGGSNAGSNVTFTLCDARGPEHATTLVLSNTGKLRAGEPSASAARSCVHGG